MSELTNPHDKFFKAALTQPDAARSFLRDYLPAAVAETLDLARLQLIKDSFVDETLQEQFSDLLYEVGLRDCGTAVRHTSVYSSSTRAMLTHRPPIRCCATWCGCGITACANGLGCGQ